MSAALQCPACGREAAGQSRCSQCSTDLSLLQLLAGLPVETASPPRSRPPLVLAVVGMAVGLGLGTTLTSLRTPDPVTVAVTAGPSATPPAAASPKAVPEGFHYRIRPGDSLWRIAARLYGTGEAWRRIAGQNPDLVPQHLTVGTVIVVPDTQEERP